MPNYKDHEGKNEPQIQDSVYLGRWKDMILEEEMDVGNIIFLKMGNACRDVCVFSKKIIRII